jgi:ribonuclease J
LALMCDSTNVFVEGHTESEAKVRESLIKLVGQQKKRVAIGLFASNVARLETCALAALAHGRQPALVGRSLIRIWEAAREVGYLKNIPKFLSENEAMKLPRDKVLMLCTGSQGEPRAALSRIAEGSHPRVYFEKGDTVIFSSRQIPSNELSISELKRRLRMNGIQVISDGEEFTHVSGHPARDELIEMYNLVRPQILVPVHGEHAHMQEQAQLGLQSGIPQVLVPFNGSLIRLCPQKPEVIEEVANGRLCLDGTRIVSLISNHLRERQRMMREGLTVVTLLIGKSNEIAEPTLTFVGLTMNKEEETLLSQGVLLELASLIKEAEPETWMIDEKIEKICQTAVRRAVRALSGHKPYVVTHIIRVEVDV